MGKEIRYSAVMKYGNQRLRERGPGDFIADAESATRQHGELRFRLANLCEDMVLLEAAQKAAKENGAKALPDAVTPDAR